LIRMGGARCGLPDSKGRASSSEDGRKWTDVNGLDDVVGSPARGVSARRSTSSGIVAWFHPLPRAWPVPACEAPRGRESGGSAGAAAGRSTCSHTGANARIAALDGAEVHCSGAFGQRSGSGASRRSTCVERGGWRSWHRSGGGARGYGRAYRPEPRRRTEVHRGSPGRTVRPHMFPEPSAVE
jgi:hypothetical protein